MSAPGWYFFADADQSEAIPCSSTEQASEADC